MAEKKYISLQSSGVDTKAFYNDLGFSISEICNKTGISRASLTRIPVHLAAKRTVMDAVAYMEIQNGKMYEDDIACIQQNFEALQIRAEEAWKRYERCEKVLAEYRKKYDLEQKCPKINQMSEEILFNRSAKE